MTRWLRLLVAGLVFAAAAAGAQPTGAAAAPALQAALDWLAQMDETRYGEAWDAAGALFKKGVPRADWVAKATTGRGNLGAVRSRKAGSSTAETNPPGAPAGEYVRLEFDTEFAASSPARKELVALVRDTDNLWRVVGYFIR